MTDDQDIQRPKGETVSSVNEIAIVGKFGFLRVEGPFEYEKEGTVWTVEISEDGLPNSFTWDSLLDAEGKCAVAIADGQVIAGGVVIDAHKLEDKDELLLAVNQYAK